MKKSINSKPVFWPASTAAKHSLITILSQNKELQEIMINIQEMTQIGVFKLVYHDKKVSDLEQITQTILGHLGYEVSEQKNKLIIKWTLTKEMVLEAVKDEL